MSFALLKQPLVTEADYLTREAAADFKSEFWYGRIYAMAGTAEPHVSINTNLFRFVDPQLDGTECRVYGKDVQVRTSPEGLLTYPDLTVVCGERQFLPRKLAVLLNPTALFEILSDSTAKADRGGKWQAYQEIESLRDYVLIAQNEPRIEHFARQEDGRWLYQSVIGLNASLTLSGVPVTLHLAEIYRNVVFSPTLFEAEDGTPPE